MAAGETTDLEKIAEDVKEIFVEYNPQLVQCLPMKDPKFIATLTQHKLFSGSLKEDVTERNITKTEAAFCFLSRAVERPLNIGDREPFEKLLLVMEKFDDLSLNKLAKEIKSVIHQKVKHPVTEMAVDENQMFTPEQIPTSESPSFAEALQSHQYGIKWTPCSDLPCKLYDASAAVSSAGDKVYVTAGSAPDDNTYNNVYCYNTNINHWTVLPRPGHRRGILHMLDDKLTIFGGTDPVTHQYHNKVTTYNNDTNSWCSEYPDMLKNRFLPGVITYNNYVIVMGGMSSPDNFHDNIEIMEYHHELQWKNVSVKLPVPMHKTKPTISGDNITIVGYGQAGGYQRKRYYQIAIEEILDQPPSTSTTSNKWKMLSYAQYYFTATVPYSNPPVIIGGSVKGVATCDITLYDSSRNSWRKVDSLTSARDSVGVALLNNNSIIIIGGCNGGVGVEGAMASSLTTVEIGNIVPKQ